MKILGQTVQYIFIFLSTYFYILIDYTNINILKVQAFSLVLQNIQAPMKYSSYPMGLKGYENLSPYI